MVNVRKRKIGNAYYYYLEHSIKVGKKVEKKEKYLGKDLPEDIEKQKRLFLSGIYKEKWYGKFDVIKRNFSKEFGKLPPEIKKKYMENLSIKYTYNTNRIEGGTLSYKDTARLLHDKISPSNKPTEDIKETENHNKVFNEMLHCGKNISLALVLEWHWEIFKDTKPDVAGKIRDYPIAIAGSKFEPPLPIELNALLSDFFKWYNKEKNKYHPVELAALVHLKFVSIHPFGDGNGRISRLLMNYVLNSNGYPMLNIEYTNRSSYYNALERAQVKKEDQIFVNHILKRYMKAYGKYL